MRSCTFFGHRDCPELVGEEFARVVTQLIVNDGVDFFYVGNQGQFDKLALRVLRMLHAGTLSGQFEYAVVLAYHPERQSVDDIVLQGETMFPEELETVHPKYAISRRNEWLLSHSEFVVGYSVHDWGGAAQYLRKARQQGKTIKMVQLGLSHH